MKGDPVVGRLLIVVRTAAILLLLVSRIEAAELRGLWVDAFHPGFKSPTETSELIRKAKDCHFNAIFVQVRKRGNVYYRSLIEPMALDIAPPYDPLEDIVTKAHAAGLEVHAWLSAYEVYRDSVGMESSPSQVHFVHPEWLMKDDRGLTVFPDGRVYLDPGLPEVRSYLVSLAQEVVSKYQVEGIHLDGLRYPSRNAGYNDVSVATFNQESSHSGIPSKDDEAWCTWRREQVTKLVSMVCQRCTQVRPRVSVSVAVLADDSASVDQSFQDWQAWVKAGTIDFAVPMVFSADRSLFHTYALDVLKLSGSRPVYIGQGAYKSDVQTSLDQVADARNAGAHGIVIYSYAYSSQTRPGQSTSFMDALKSGPFSQPDSVPVLAWKQ